MTEMVIGRIDPGTVYSPPLAQVIEREHARRVAIWKPQKGPQQLAYDSKADILGYGGAAGGGKSDLILGLALTRHRRSIVFRREHTEVRDLFARAAEIVDTVANVKINHGLSTIYMPAGDRQLEFGGIKNLDDWRKHRGRAKDAHLFDEATEFEEIMIRSLIGWNRTTIPGQRCRVVLAFNPPGVKRGQWLINFFAPWLDPKYPKPAEYGELRWFTTINGRDIECPNGDPVDIDGEMCLPLSRTFIRALLDDNEYLKNTKYRATLMGLPEPLRSQLLYGDFNAEEADDPHQTIPTKWVQLAQERWIEQERPQAPLSAIGADVARGGTNRTAFAARIGTWFDYPVAFPGSETPKGRDVLRKLAEFVSNYKVTRKVPVGMDVVGVGSSPSDLAEELNMQLIALSGAEAADENLSDDTGLLPFANKRAQWYWQLRQALNPETGDNLALPPDRELLADLCAPHYDVGLRGIKIEDKDDIIKRLGRSPDKGDATVYAFAARPLIVGYETVQSRPATGQIAQRMNSDWKKKKGM